MNHIIFSIPKPFVDKKTILAQKNAILSWLQIVPKENIIIFSNDLSTQNFCKSYELNCISDIKINAKGTPFLTDAFNKVEQYFNADIYTYINADIILLPQFDSIIKNLSSQLSEFLAIGCRWNVDIDFEIDFNVIDWANRLEDFTRTHGQITNTTWTDYFTFTKGFWNNSIPEFLIGRTIFDVWFLTYALLNYKNIVNVTENNLVVHQNHTYNLFKNDKNEAWFGEEAYFNHKNAGKYYYLGNIKYAYFKLENNQLKKNWELNGFKTKEEFLNFAIYESAIDLLVNAKYDKTNELLELLETKKYKTKNFYYTYALSHLNQGNTEEAIKFFKLEYKEYGNEDIITTINKIKNYKLFNINFSAIIYGFKNFNNINTLIKTLKNLGINSIYLISNSPGPAIDNSIPYIEANIDDLSYCFNKIIKNSELNEHVLFINGDLFNITPDFTEKLNKVYQPFNYVQLFYFNALQKNDKNEIKGFFIQRDYFYEHQQMLYYHLISNKILFDCFVVKRNVFEYILFEVDNKEFIHKFWIQFFRLQFVAKLVPYYITEIVTPEYYNIHAKLNFNINKYTIENIFYLLENVKFAEIFPHLTLGKQDIKNYGDVSLFLFNRLKELKLYKAAISLVCQVAAYTQSVDILNICIPFLIENFDLKLLKNILTEFNFLFEKNMYEKLIDYINQHMNLTISLFEKSNEFDKIIKIKF